MATDQEVLIQKLVGSPLTAHRLFFGDRHSVASPKFHSSIINDWHSQKPKVLTLAFRGAAKSTLAEEAITVIAALDRREIALFSESLRQELLSDLDQSRTTSKPTNISKRRSASDQETSGPTLDAR